MNPVTWLTALTLLAAGCVGTDVGNPPDDRRITATLEFEAYDPTAVRALTTSDGVRIEEAWIALDAIRVGSGDCGSDVEKTVSGPFYVELVARIVIPEPPVIANSPTTICALKLDVGPALADDAPVELENGSLFVRGSDADGEFILRSSSQRILPYLGDVDVTGDRRFVDVFDPSDWAEHLGGKHEISDGDAPVINAFWNSLRRGSRIVEDRDADGRVSPSEFDVPVAWPQ